MLNLKVLLLVSCLALIASAQPGAPGGETQLKGSERKEAIELLRKSLRELAAGDGPSYTIRKVVSVTSQVVQGTIYKYQVALAKNNKGVKKCNASIWSRPWLENGSKLTINCPGEPVVQQTLSS